MFETELETAIRSVRSAAQACQLVQSQISPAAVEKQDKSPVTIADYASQALVCRQLLEAFPEDPVIGEEGAGELRSPEQAAFLAAIVETLQATDVTATGPEVCDWIDRGGLQEYRPRFWTLDPIDGTKGFLRKDQYAISLALLVEGDIKLGVLGCPNLPMADGQPRGVLAWAVEGRGAWMQPLGEPQAAPVKLHVTDTSKAASARFCESVESGHSAHGWSEKIAKQLSITNEPYRIDSQCKYLAVARGDADLYLRLPTRKGYQEKIWDHAGGVQVVREAGGRVTDIHGQALDFRQGATLANNQGVVVTNAQFHDDVIQAVQAHAPAEP